MAEDILVIPPIRQSLEDIASAKTNELDLPKTEKSWYLYWQQTGDQVNLNTDKLNKLITYGPHAGRPPADTMPAGSLYMETDRSNVIYQNINGVWQYLTGTMWGTITPDLRPTDLGVHDGGFNYRGTDDAREFIWSQSTWIEVTAVRYGTHAGRPAPATVADGSIYVESDRGGVIYQQQAGVWKYLAGTMYGTLSPDLRPTDLGVNDGGFDFRGTDQQREFIWSQTVWVEVTAESNSLQVAYASGSVVLTTAWQQIPGTLLILPRAGKYLVNGVFYFSCLPADSGNYLVGSISDSAAEAFLLTPTLAAGQKLELTASQQWSFTAPAPNSTISLQAIKFGGAGASTVGPTHTSISALWVGP